MTVGLGWCIFAGIILGMLAHSFKVDRAPSGTKAMLLTMAIGIAGAVALSFVGIALGLFGREQMGAFVASLVGAAALLLAWRFYPHGGTRAA